ncbi:MAG: undecaprenyl-diphosphate phosphatase, partial [Actinobacteria bacterium]|nr:undecaprenyl-diphosphate phosphatase [Actinomycetota bacterium]
MSWFEAIVLGIIQGLTEFLPISSSGHLLILSQIFGWDDPGAAFTAVSQIGTETAVLIYFRRDIWRIISTWTKSLYTPALRGQIDARMGWYVIVGTIPIGFFGFFFSDQIETAARNLWLVATVLIVFGIILGIADRVGRKTRELETLSMRSGLLFGLGQALALIPGVSRSGATITTGLFLGFTREAATRYAFLLAIPAVLASGLYQATKIGDEANVPWGQTIVATAIAFVIGYLVIAWLIRYVATNSYMPFVIYRVALGSLVLV